VRCASDEFSRIVRKAPDSPEVGNSAGRWTLSPDKPISGRWTIKKKRELFPGFLPTSSSSVTLPCIHIQAPES